MDSSPEQKPTCRIPDCPTAPFSRGLCNTHYAAARRHGTLDQYPPTKRGNPFVNYHGYRVVHRPGHPLSNSQGHVLEHRLVAWETYGPFDMTAHVHHRNGDKLDNTPANLEVLDPVAHGKKHHQPDRKTRPQLDRSEARRLYESGMTTIEVAAAMGTHPGNVSRMIRQAGGQARPSSSRRMQVDEDLIERLWRSDTPYKAIASLAGCSTTVVGRVARERGLPPRGRGAKPKPKPPCPQCGSSKDRYSDVCHQCRTANRLAAGPSKEDLESLAWKMPAAEIGALYGLTGSAVPYRFQKWGVAHPSIGWWARRQVAAK